MSLLERGANYSRERKVEVSEETNVDTLCRDMRRNAEELLLSRGTRSRGAGRTFNTIAYSFLALRNRRSPLEMADVVSLEHTFDVDGEPVKVRLGTYNDTSGGADPRRAKEIHLEIQDRKAGWMIFEKQRSRVIHWGGSNNTWDAPLLGGRWASPNLQEAREYREIIDGLKEVYSPSK